MMECHKACADRKLVAGAGFCQLLELLGGEVVGRGRVGRLPGIRLRRIDW